MYISAVNFETTYNLLLPLIFLIPGIFIFAV